MPSIIQKDDLYQRLQSFCAYRERCSFEAEQKLHKIGAGKFQIKLIIDKLKKEGFINELRFAKTYAQSKLFNNKWGKIKTEIHLKQLNIPDNYIKRGIESINEEEYENILQKIIVKKYGEMTNNDNEIKKNKTARYCIQKGFEPSLVWRLINNH